MTKRKLRVLLTCAGGSATIYFAQTLRKKYDLVLADATDSFAATWLRLPFVRLPFGNDKAFPAALAAAVKKYKIDVIVPGADEELIPVRRFCNASCGNVFAILPASEAFIALCLDKRDLMIALDREGVSTLLPFANPSAVKYPAVAKPRSGRGSREVHTIRSKKELNGYLSLYGKRFSELVVQPYIKGQEFTTSVLVNDRNQLIGIVPKKVLAKRGITQCAVAESEPGIERACRLIVERFKPGGPFNVQSMQVGGKTFIFEINPRLSTTAVLTDKAFANEIDASLRFRGMERVKSPYRLKSGWHLARYYDNVFFKG